MQMTTSDIRQKYKINRQKLHYANRRGLRFKKKIKDGRAVNVYVEKDVLKFFGVEFGKREPVRS
jgi:hypothetical protein